MKNKLFYIVCLFVLASLPAKAQIGEHRNDLAIGVNGGYTFNKMMFTPTIQQFYKEAPTFGITIRYTCEKYFKSLCSIQAEINYANLGWKENIETSEDQYTRNIQYLQIPFLARMGWGYEKKGALFFIVAGPQLGFYLDDNDERKGPFNEESLNLRPGRVNQQYDMPVKNTFEYGITAGAGLEINTKIGHFILEGRYYYGLSDVFGNSKKDVFGRSANGTIIAKASYLFDIIRTKQ